MRRWLWLALGLVGCDPALKTGTRANFDAQHRSAVGRRAGFDLACPEPELTFTPIGSRPMDGGDYTTVGVSGCGKRASYQLLQGGWILTQPATADDGSAPATGELPGGAGASKTGAALAQYVMKSPDVQVLIERRKPGGPGFGGTNVSMEAGPLWPPSGPSCEALTACCEQRLSQDDRFELLCPFAVVRHHNDCPSALATVNQIGAELGLHKKGACKPQ